MTFKINMSGASGYTGPYENQGSDLFPFQGITFGDIVKVETGVSKSESKNNLLNFEVICREDPASGCRVRKSQPVSGMRSDKKPNVVGLWDILTSVYTETLPLDAAIAKVKEFEGSELDADGAIEETLNRRVYFEVQARQFTRADGTTGWSSEIRNFLPKQKYLDAVKAKVAHRPNPPEASMTTTTPDAAASNSNSANSASMSKARSIM